MIKKDSLREWDYTLENYYGIGIEVGTVVHKDEHFVLQVLARMAIRLRSRFRHAYAVLLLPSDTAVLHKRLRDRGYSERDLQLRLHHGLEEAAHAPLFDQVVKDAECMDIPTVTRVLADIRSAFAPR